MPAKKKQQASAAEQNTTKKVKPAAVEAEPAEVNEVTQVTVAPKKKSCLSLPKLPRLLPRADLRR